MKKEVFLAILVISLMPFSVYANEINLKGHIVEYTCESSSMTNQKKCAQKISKTETHVIDSVIKENPAKTQILTLTYY